MFPKSKTNTDEEKRLGFRSDSICRVEVYLPSIFHTCAVETVKSCIIVILVKPIYHTKFELKDVNYLPKESISKIMKNASYFI